MFVRMNCGIGLQTRKHTSLGSGRDHDVLGIMRLRAAVRRLDLDFTAAFQGPEAFDPLDLVLLHQSFDALGVLGHDAVLAALHKRHIQAWIVAVDALFLRIFEVLPHIGAMQQGLGRNAADMETGTPELRVLFDDRRLQTILPGADGSRVSARSAADDD